MNEISCFCCDSMTLKFLSRVSSIKSLYNGVLDDLLVAYVSHCN